MLKALVEKSGWPSKSQVGERASNLAWLLAQHADRDPAFQLKALRLMEPLAARGEVSKRNYAYLYDRVMLKLTGRQLYATQFWCRDGRHQPQPLERESDVGRLRAGMELESLDEYREQMHKMFGDSCK